MQRLIHANRRRTSVSGAHGRRIAMHPAWALALAVVIAGPAASGGELPALVPAPRQVNWSAEPPANLKPDAVAIVIGNSATDPEQHAARMLREAVAKRFGQQWPIVREGKEEAKYGTLVILGQRTTCGRINDLCAEHQIELSETSPGYDGYVIEMFNEGNVLLAMVGGCNARGVEYGQDTLFQMLRASGTQPALVRGSVRDAPAVPWRGRPQTAVKHYLRPGELDLYVTSRVNFIDLRGGIYAFEPGEELNRAEIAEAVQAAHRRGLIIYGTVNCGVARTEHDKVLATFRELLDLGADALWLSFDDKGPGEDPVALVNRVLDLGRPRQITGNLIAITPPKGSYQRIVTEFNRKILAVPGMETAIWFWTGVPSTEAVQEARSIGLKAKPGWWHNWPRVWEWHAYTGVPPLSLGWHAADYDVLTAGGECLDAVMPWGGNSYGQHYVVPVIDWWGWNPQGHDGNALRRRIYSIVYGEDQISAAMQFDDDLQRLFAMFLYAYKNSDDLPFCPPRLRVSADHKSADALIAEMASLLQKLGDGAPKGTLLPEAELKSAYLDPMRQELETHQAAVGLAYPEGWWPEEQRRVLDAVYANDTARIDQLMSRARDRILSETDQIAKALPSYPHMQPYVDWWRQRASLDAGGWKALIENRRKALNERVREYGRQIVNTATMLEGLRSPPLEWGIGRWQVHNRVLAAALPSPNEWFWGDWMAGLHEQDGLEAAVFAADRRTPGDAGEYAELQVVVPVSGRRDRLALLIFVSSTNKDLFSNTMVKYRWAGYRFIELRRQDQVLWETDLGRVPERGDWFLVRLPRLPEDMKDLVLRLRAEDRKLSVNNYTICYVGPIRLMELPE